MSANLATRSAEANTIEESEASILAQRPKTRQQFSRELSQMLSPLVVLSSEEELRPYESNGLTAMSATPLLVVLPDTIEQVQQIMCWVKSNRVPVVARGAGPGLQPVISRQLRDKKVGSLLAEEPDIIATSNIGSQPHTQGGSGRPVVHWIEQIDQLVTS